MIDMPEIIKAQRDLTGKLAIAFKGDDGKEFETAFSDIRAGVSWPIRSLPGYLAILGLYSGAVLGNTDSLMLIYEKQYSNSIDLMTDAYNRAHDLRFQLFYTDRRKGDWEGFNFEFQRKIRSGLGAGDIRLNHSPFAPDFMMGKDTIKRFVEKKAIHIPLASLFMRQLMDFGPKTIKTEHPEHEFHALNGVRYVLVAWDLQGKYQERTFGEGRKISVEGWA